MKHTIFHSIGFYTEALSENMKDKPNTVVIDSLRFDHNNLFKFCFCDSDTRVIVFTILGHTSFKIESLYNYVSEGITVEKKFERGFYIKPYWIILTTERIDSDKAASLSERFDLIDSSVNPLFEAICFKPFEP